MAECHDNDDENCRYDSVLIFAPPSLLNIPTIVNLRPSTINHDDDDDDDISLVSSVVIHTDNNV